MNISIYIIDGIDHEYNYTVKSGKAYDVETGKAIERIWVYPVKQAVIGGEPVMRYFTSTELRAEYMASHDHCDALPRCKVPEID